MIKTNWRYHNHALLPTCAPHESPNTDEIKDGLLFKSYNKAYLARWTTDWDMNEESDWYYLCCFKPFSLEGLSKSARNTIRKALRNCSVKRINPKDYLNEMWTVYKEAYAAYKNPIGMTTEDDFKKSLINSPSDREYWAAFEVESGKMIGYDIVTVYEDYVSDTVGKYSYEYRKLGACDAITFTLLDYYLSNDNIIYVTDGERTVSHNTNIHDYLIQRFKFRKVYCRLNIKYRLWVGIIIKIIYPFRKLFYKFESNRFISQVSGVLMMEEIYRKSK